jgi:DNA mismatch endonuclease (patch repair protein)
MQNRDMPGTGPSLPTTDVATSRRMARQRRRDTAPEMAIRRLLHARGFRYRVNAPIPGMPRRRADLTFRTRKVAVFVDGCFWHGCPQHRTQPRANGAWWYEKLQRNVERDREADEHLQGQGWLVIRIWEHEDPETAADRVELALRGR